MKNFSIQFLAFILIMFVSCSNPKEESVDVSTNDNTTEVEAAPTKEAEQVEKEPLSVAEKIKGKWQQTHQRCDANGENGKEMSKETFWSFDGSNVTWSKFTHPYRVEGEQILIGEGEGSPYEIEKDDGEIIVLHAVKTDRYMRLVRVAEQ